MPDLFTDSAERRALVDDAAARLGVASWVVEKDLWVCWLLARLQEIQGLPALTFKGGTSLSKVHRLVDRFSEDIDLTFSRDGWGFDGERDPLADGLSGKARARLVEEVGAKAAQTVGERVVPALTAICGALLGATGWEVRIDAADPQAVLFRYPEPAAAYGYGQPVVKAEFGARGDPWPTSVATVTPYLEEVHSGVAGTAIASVATLRAERTFWEKVTLLHALHHGTLAKPDKSVARLSRHLYDVHRMWRAPALRDAVVAGRDLYRAVVRNKMTFFAEGKARYELAGSFALSATPHPGLDARLRADYAAMKDMFFPGSAVPAFDELVQTARQIDAEVADWPSGSP